MRSLFRLSFGALALCLLHTTPVLGGPPGSPIPPPPIRDPGDAIAGPDLRTSLETRPPGPRFDRTDAILALGLGAAALLSTEIEDPGGVSRALDGSPLDGGMDVGNAYGDGAVLGSVALGLLAAGGLADNPRLSGAGRDLTESLIAAWAITWSLKFSVNARRPDGGPHSFPSGHTATAFAAAPVFARHFGRGMGTLAYGLAGLTAVGRMEDRRHYAADVLFGAAIGIVAGRMFSGESGFRLAVPAGGQGVGLAVGF